MSILLAPTPSNEKERVRTLQKLDVANPDKYLGFDRITRVMVALFDTPIAMVNMITADEEVNKSCIGLPAGGRQHRGLSMCTYTILSDEPLIVENTLEDDRFKDNPNITGLIKVRAYAGVPISANDGTHPGALCLIDTEPRKFSTQEIDLLKDLCRWAELELEDCNK